jgi:hypothetical protein
VQSSPVPSPPPPAPERESDSVVVSGTRISDDKITNTQEADVDEGGIVKKRGDILVILRRGRLFTVSIAGGQIRPIDRIDAYAPDLDEDLDWYDEMLIAGNRIVVVGYSYERGGTELNRFTLLPGGRLRFDDAYHLRSNDYYSSENYASRMIGNRLIFYTPLYLDGSSLDESLPGLSRWRGSVANSPFKRIAGKRSYFIARRHLADEDVNIDTAHTVTECDVSAAQMPCKATVVIGPSSHSFYVSPGAVYLWASDAWTANAAERGFSASMLYRLPLGGTEKPSAIATRGAPTNQFSFREDRDAGLIDVLLRSESGGDWMFRKFATGGEVALLSVPIGWLGDGGREVPRSRYRFLPSPDGWDFQNRFVGRHILYGTGDVDDAQGNLVFAVGLRGGPIAELRPGHGTERLDQIGNDGITIGNDSRGGLTFTAIDLTRPMARLGNTFTFPSAEQGESRSQAFYYRPDNADGSNGLLGLPINKRMDEQLQKRVEQLFGSSASILFLKRQRKLFDLAGELASRPELAADDDCKASCVDWYGNARPIFVGDRVFALMGYELVEGRMVDGRIREIGRLNFAPAARAESR